MGWIRPRLPPWALEDVNDLDQVRRYAMYMTSGKPGAFDDHDEGEILGFSASSVSNFVMPDVWADQDENTEQNSFAWQAGLPASLQTYRPPRPRPYMRPAAEPLPGHAESYNPPPEFLLSEEEVGFYTASRSSFQGRSVYSVWELFNLILGFLSIACPFFIDYSRCFW